MYCILYKSIYTTPLMKKTIQLHPALKPWATGVQAVSCNSTTCWTKNSDSKIVAKWWDSLHHATQQHWCQLEETGVKQMITQTKNNYQWLQRITTAPILIVRRQQLPYLNCFSSNYKLNKEITIQRNRYIQNTKDAGCARLLSGSVLENIMFCSMFKISRFQHTV